MPAGVPTPKRIEVVISHHEVVAYVLASREREVAVRSWSLQPMEGGIIRHCDCEKGAECKNHGVILRPMEWTPMGTFFNKEFEALAEEYGLPLKQVNFNRHMLFDSGPVPIPKLELFGLWLDREAMQVSRATFDRLYGKK